MLFIRLLELLPKQAVKKTIARALENAEGPRLRQPRRRMGVERFCYRQSFWGDEVVRCSALKEPELTARKS